MCVSLMSRHKTRDRESIISGGSRSYCKTRYTYIATPDQNCRQLGRHRHEIKATVVATALSTTDAIFLHAFTSLAASNLRRGYIGAPWICDRSQYMLTSLHP